MEHVESRIEGVRTHMAERQIDGLLILNEANRFYLSGFSGEDHQCDESAGALFISREALLLLTDSRFELQAQQQAPLYEVTIYRQGLAEKLSECIQRSDVKRLGMESTRVTVHQQLAFLKEFQAKSVPVELVPVDELVEQLRMIKSPDEIDRTYRALSIAEEVFRHVVKNLHPGLTEKQVAWQMEMGMRQAGADALSFPVILASGPNSALPHAIPTDREIKAGEPILFDWGCKLAGYCSDTSRTVVIGPPDDAFLRVYQTVLEAQKRGVQAVKAGASTKMVDAAARDFIDAQGYGGKFGHGLGHGTGLAVHEAPRLSPLRDTPLQSGMIVTVEPGIYLPDWGGVRLEHQVVVRPDGAEVMDRLSLSCDIDQI